MLVQKRDALDIAALVNDDASQISRRVFTDAAVYAREKSHIFGRSWLYLGHESQLRQANDFITARAAQTPLIVARDSNGKLHASVNSCLHRGLPVCRADHGNASRFICPYHGWSYALDGQLAAMPQARHLSNPPATDGMRLKPMPRVDSWRGLIFGSFNEDVPPLDQYLGNMRFYLDAFFDRFEGGVEVVGPPHKWLLNANWKLPVENQLGDVAHGPLLHRALLADNPAIDEINRYGFNVVPEPGHGAALRLMPETADPMQVAWGLEGPAALSESKPLREYLLATQNAAAQRVGAVRARIKGLTFGVYPNLSFLFANATLRVSHPCAPGQVAYWSWWLTPAAAVDEVRQLLRSNYTFMFGPGGILEQEDSEAWRQQLAGSAADFADDLPYCYALGLDEEARHPQLPGMVGSCYNEHYARQFYLRWREDMQGDAE